MKKLIITIKTTHKIKLHIQFENNKIVTLFYSVYSYPQRNLNGENNKFKYKYQIVV